jgi:acetyl-CoA C-acetyltransferase
MEVAATTVDSQCGSSQQATSLATGLVGSGIVDVAIACGAEVMSRVQMGASMPSEPDSGFPIPDSYSARYEMTSQFEGAERIADKWGITRRDCDEYGKRSQDLCAAAWGEDRVSTQIVPTVAPVADDHGTPSGERLRLERDEGLRETSLDKLAQLKPVGRPDGVHTAGSSSQVSDGAGAVMVTTQRRATELGLTPKVRVLDTCLVGSDPVLMLTGPIDATRTLLERNGMTMADIDVVEINEAFASVVLAWARELTPDMAVVNPNGGAIAHGHPLGGTGAILMAKAVHELERSDKSVALVTMCCGGGLGTGTLLERVG